MNPWESALRKFVRLLRDEVIINAAVHLPTGDWLELERMHGETTEPKFIVRIHHIQG